MNWRASCCAGHRPDPVAKQKAGPRASARTHGGLVAWLAGSAGARWPRLPFDGEGGGRRDWGRSPEGGRAEGEKGATEGGGGERRASPDAGCDRGCGSVRRTGVEQSLQAGRLPGGAEPWSPLIYGLFLG